MEGRKRAIEEAAEELARARADLQDAIDQTALPGDRERKLRNMERARRREQAAFEALRRAEGGD